VIRNLPDEILSACLELIPGNYPAIHIMPPEKHLPPNKDEETRIRIVFFYNTQHDIVLTDNDNIKVKLKEYLQKMYVLRSD